MAVYLTIDAGGSKCSALLFDDQLRLLGRAKTGGVNTTQTTPEEARENVARCLDEVLGAVRPTSIRRVYACFVGPVEILQEELARRCPVEETVRLSEHLAGMLAGALQKHGILAISGTGSDVFWVRDPAEPGHYAVGGWGPILGDQGSGTWIGQQALREAAKTADGWGCAPRLLALIREAWSLPTDFSMVGTVHRSAAPFRQVASITPLVGRAAAEGDPFALRLVREAGEVMARQVFCLLRRFPVPAADRKVVCCGGAWKTHPAMFEAFRDALLAQYPELEVCKPWFEHVMAGPASLLLERGLSPAEAKALLDAHFPDDRIGW